MGPLGAFHINVLRLTRLKYAPGVPFLSMPALHEVKLYGRGGQGIVTAGELIARAAVAEGLHAQSMPQFGPERRGGPAICSLRISDEPILLKTAVTTPGVVAVFDPTVWHFVPVTLGFRDGGTLLFNTQEEAGRIEAALKDGKHGPPLVAEDFTIHTLDATGIAMEVYGRAITNAPMMGAFARVTGLVDFASVEKVLAERFPDNAERNLRAAREGYEALKA